MNISFKLIGFTLFLIMPGLVHSQSYSAGTHYSVIKKSTPSFNQEDVVEYFSYSCPGCFAMEPHIKSLEKNLPSIQLRRVHLPFGGTNAILSQKAFVLLKLLKAEKHHDRIFNRIHIAKNVFDDQDELIGFFQGLGYEGSLVKSYLSSFAADTLLRSMNLEAKKNQIGLAPTIIVRGKYLIDAGAVYSGTNLPDLVVYLMRLSDNEIH